MFFSTRMVSTFIPAQAMHTNTGDAVTTASVEEYGCSYCTDEVANSGCLPRKEHNHDDTQIHEEEEQHPGKPTHQICSSRSFSRGLDRRKKTNGWPYDFLIIFTITMVLSSSFSSPPMRFAAARPSYSAISSSRSSHKFTSLYRWGNLGHVPKKQEVSSVRGKIEQTLKKMMIIPPVSDVKARFLRFCRHELFPLAIRMARASVFWYFSKDCLHSIYEDRWHAERDPEHFFGTGGMWITHGAHKTVVRRRIQRSKRNRQWVGLGYTPRLVWLVGVLLRGTFQCTSIPKVFNPKLTGWGAGTILGAKCTHQEWIAAFMIGWFGSEYYWTYLFGCDGPPYPNPNGGFDGVPISITKVRVF